MQLPPLETLPDLHPSRKKLLNEFLGGVFSAVNQKRHDVPNNHTFSEGDAKHLVLAQIKALSDPLDARLMPNIGHPTPVASDALGH